ncbi:MAG: hypothetical protein ISS17_09340 [Bacteroidales bacterium]|nr:hypothetical protein [Deltaproteobacteria bacterium]MBL7138963.1 hypothetical protein [Bacteroidales bacterium]
MADPIHKSKKETKKKRTNPWTLRIIVILFIWILIYFFFAGPGRILFPSLLISYSSVSDNKNTVYFYGDRIEKALDILWLASITQDSIRQFSGDTTTDEFSSGVTIFFCESPRQYFHLTWNKAMGSAIMGRIVLNEALITGNMSQYSAIIHEMYHLYITRKHGYLPSILFYPKWFEEGCATMLQDYSIPANNLGNYLQKQPTLVTVTSLEHPWNWQTMVRMEDGKMAPKGYGQVCLFARYLVDRYGIEKLREYGSRLHWNLAPDRTFGQVFQTPLAKAESQWLQTMVEAREAPPETAFIPLPFDFLIFLRWLFVVFVILFPLFLLVRWIFRTIIHRRQR